MNGRPDLPQTIAKRQEALRARRLAQGLTEVRGIYLPQAKHVVLKEIAKELQKGVDKLNK